ncbi:hypothetical protein V1522DRAFT_358600, partial [Lipomyces starkeyi]
IASTQLARELADSAVEREIDRFLLQANVRAPKPFDLASIPVPSSVAAEKAVAYVKNHLEPSIFNHSNRVYYLGAAMVADYLPQWNFDLDTYFLTSIFHGIGISPDFQLKTPLSFEYWGGINAREKLVEFGASQFQADEVAEAIIRHTDMIDGNLRQNGVVLQMTTTLDIRGCNPQWFHSHTIDQIVKEFPRQGFKDDFARAVERETEGKPGCYTSFRDIPAYLNYIWTNPVMAVYDNAQD